MADESRQIILLIFFRITRSIAAGMISLAFPYLVLTTLHYGPLKLGVLYTAAAIATAVLGLLFGFLADVWGRKRTLVLVGVLVPASSALVCLSGQFGVLMAASILGGYSATGSLAGGGVGGAAQPIQSAVVADLTSPRTRTRYFAVLTFISGVFAAFGAFLVRFFGIHQTFWAATVVSFLGLGFLAPLRSGRIKGNPRRLESRRTIGKFTLTGILNGFSQGLVTPFLIPFFVLVFHVPKEQMAVYAFASGLLASFSILAAPRLEARLGFVQSIAVTRGLGALLLAILPFSKFLAVALAIYVLTPGLRIMALPVQQTALTEMVERDEVGRALGINQVARLASSAGAIAFTGAMFDISEIPLPFLLYGAVMAANIYLYFRFFGLNSVDDRARPL
jgi:MFS family permease